MLAGAHGIDAVALVIAADEGVMPQTREHFDISKLLGVRGGLVVVTKLDTVDEELLALARAGAGGAASSSARSATRLTKSCSRSCARRPKSWSRARFWTARRSSP